MIHVYVVNMIVSKKLVKVRNVFNVKEEETPMIIVTALKIQ